MDKLEEIRSLLDAALSIADDIGDVDLSYFIQEALNRAEG